MNKNIQIQVRKRNVLLFHCCKLLNIHFISLHYGLHDYLKRPRLPSVIIAFLRWYADPN